MTRDDRDFASLYLSERDRLTRQISRRVGNQANASDLVQDIFLRLWERAAAWNGSPSAFLTRCARNAAIDHIRAERARAELAAGLRPELTAAPVPTPLDELAARQGARSVEDALAALPKRTRHIFLLNRVHGRTFREIAAVMGISERAVAKHMAVAVSACAIALEASL